MFGMLKLYLYIRHSYITNIFFRHKKFVLTTIMKTIFHFLLTLPVHLLLIVSVDSIVLTISDTNDAAILAGCECVLNIASRHFANGSTIQLLTSGLQNYSAINNTISSPDVTLYKIMANPVWPIFVKQMIGKNGRKSSKKVYVLLYSNTIVCCNC